MSAPDYEQFTCNLCGKESAVVHDFHREGGACQHCGSNIRFRALMLALSHHLYGKPIPLCDFSSDRNIKAMGLSDAPHYANKLAGLFDYTNFFYHTKPFLDICNIETMAAGSYDLLITSDVYEHVPPPRHVAFVNSHHLLKPDGLLLLTVPYTMLPKTAEHFPHLYQFGFVRDKQGMLLVNRRRDQTVEVYDELTWHGGEGSTLELRVFAEADLLQILADAGFKDITIWHEDVPEYGILQAQQGGSFVISAVKDGAATPAPITQHDPYYENIYPEDARIDHFLIHSPVRISGERAEQAIVQWNKEQSSGKSRAVSEIWHYIKQKLRVIKMKLKS
jgi:SAM-dependent methyltransferase